MAIALVSLAVPLQAQGAPFTQPLPASTTAGQSTLRANAGQSLAAGPDVVCVGAPGDSVRGFDAGSVVVYRRDPVSGAFYFDQRIQPTSLSSYDRFGGAVAVSGDLLVVGAKGDDTSGPNSGAVYVFRRATAGQPFALLQRLAPPGLGVNACFGAAVAASGDTIAVGAPRTGTNGYWTGSVFTYRVDATTNAITPTGVVTDGTGAVGDEFGSAVAVSPNELFVASERLDPPGGPDNVGGVVRFTRQGTSGWIESQRLFPALASEGARFGAALALEPPRPGAQGTLVVGAPEAGPLGALGARGAVFLYTAGFGGSWYFSTQYGWWVAQTGSQRGASVATAGGVALVGAPRRGANVGGVDVLRRGAGGGWSFTGSIVLPGKAIDDFAGTSVAVMGGAPIIGVPGREVQAVDDAGEVWSSSALWAPLGSGYCVPAVPNSTGVPAALAARGTAVGATQDFVLESGYLPPGAFAYPVMSQTTAIVPNPGGSAGTLCLGGQLGRFAQSLGQAGANGRLTFELDLSDVPPPLPAAVSAGETWWFQVWFRDLDPQPTSNFTSAIGVEFL